MLKVPPLFFKNTLEKFAQRCRHYFYENSHYTVRDYAEAREKYEKFQAHLLEKIVAEIIATFESQAEDGHCYSLEQYLSAQTPATHSWVIELFEGESNFLRQIPCFAIGLTYIYDGQAQETAYLDPIHDEFFHACRGKGAQLSARRLQVQACDGPLLRLGSHQLEPQHLEAQRVLGALNLSLCWLSAGRLDLMVLKARDRVVLSPGAKLLFREAKGSCFDYIDPRNNEKYHLFGHKDILKKTLDHWNLAFNASKSS